MNLPKSIQETIEQFSRLPGIGPKSAARITFYLLAKHEGDLKKLAAAVENLKKDLRICSVCYNFAQSDPCLVCADPDRDRSLVCVVEESLDALALDRAGFKGVYHVLGGAISPIQGIGPDDIRISELISRIGDDSANIKEVVLATDPTLEGEATAAYIAERLKESGVRVTRLARGLPSGGELEYADVATLSRSLEGRKEV